ncbi:MAG: hypothetical protein U1C33_04900 [Candidatus Cloacimonadaceae bacterium]|nr:hypothetical protein [Candidatus Cloacimonadaceae bacterium]
MLNFKLYPEANEINPLSSRQQDLDPDNNGGSIKKQKPDDEESLQDEKKEARPLSPHRPTKPFRPIILCFTLIILFTAGYSYAQIGGSVSLGASYTDNVFSLSDYDFDRFDANHANLEFVETTDDLNAFTLIDLNYPLRYRWWKIEPSLAVNISNNIINTEKYRRDVLARVRVERYHWNATMIYGYYPHIYVRDYVDNDGTGELENFSYERNLYRADANLRITRTSTIRLHGRYENYYYNEYWTEFDGDATTVGLGLRHSFPLFTVNGMYYFRAFDTKLDGDSDFNDSTYESDRYYFDFALKYMPLNDSEPRGATWRPKLSLSYEERYYQGLDTWYGGRVDKIYNTTGGIDLNINAKWNISLDYSHIFRNVDSPNESVLRLKEYAENRFGATVKYNF